MVENALEVFGLVSTPDVWCALWFLSVAKFFSWRCDGGWRLVIGVAD